MNILIGVLIGYIVHDVIQPTAVGEFLDSISLKTPDE